MQTLATIALLAFDDTPAFPTPERLQLTQQRIQHQFFASSQPNAVSTGRERAHLTHALLQDCLNSVFVFSQLQRYRGTWLLSLPHSQRTLQQVLAAVLRCVALLPTDLSTVASLSCAPPGSKSDIRNRQSASHSPGADSDLPLKLRTGWFWTTATTSHGPRPGVFPIISVLHRRAAKHSPLRKTCLNRSQCQM